MSPILIAGPCSIESLHQLRSVTQALLSPASSSHPIRYIRGGVWKPRTRPGRFEGNGEKALQWIDEVKGEYPDAHFCCEVATPEHVELCLRHAVDAVWIGSRTAGNPFSVADVCLALQGCNIPILVKNPPAPDINLWLGAIERALQTGSPYVAAIHRGFTPYYYSSYRNNPMWEIPIELRRRMPDLPLLCDPSQIGGSADSIGPLMQTAMDLHFDGLMVEVHPEPEQAFTDMRQQVTPQEFFDLLEQLQTHQDADTPHALAHLRQQIDMVDAQIIDALALRLDIVKRIAQVKSDNNMAVYQPKRWDEVLQQKMSLAEEAGIDPLFIKDIYEKIHAESVKVQMESL